MIVEVSDLKQAHDQIVKSVHEKDGHVFKTLGSVTGAILLILKYLVAKEEANGN